MAKRPARQRQLDTPLQIDWWMLASVLALLAIGWVMITSASLDYAQAKYGDALFHSRRHGIYLLLAMVLSVIAYLVPLPQWQRLGPALLLLSFIVLILILIPGIGVTANNATPPNETLPA